MRNEQFPEAGDWTNDEEITVELCAEEISADASDHEIWEWNGDAWVRVSA
jgi:hypothetical protein